MRYGTHPDKLYLSWLLYDQAQLDLSTLNIMYAWTASMKTGLPKDKRFELTRKQ